MSTPLTSNFASASAPMHSFDILDYGPNAVMFELRTQSEVEDLFAYLDYAVGAGRLWDILDIVPAARTVLVIGKDPTARGAAIAVATQWAPGRSRTHKGAEHTIEVVYEGPDMDEVCEMTGMSRAEVVELHTSAEYRVAFMGFAPGFGYLTGLPEKLQLPRKKNPRTKVPPRSVAIAGEYSAVYPRTSPGGWNLLGQSVQFMWDDDAERPNLLSPGDTVRFVAVEAPAAGSEGAAS